MKKTAKKTTKSLIIGIVIVVAAALLVVGLLIIPGLQAKSAFSDRLEDLSQSQIEIATLYDPNLAVGQLGQKGKEVVITDPEILRQSFIEIAKNTEFANSRKNLGISDYDYRIRFKTSNKKVFDFFIDANQVFWVDNSGIRYYFNIKNVEIHADFTQTLSDLIKEDK